MKKVAFHTLGCKLNFSETSTVARQFTERGFLKVNFDDAADVYVINTCSVTENADKKCKRVVNKSLKRNPDAFIIVMGCYAQLKPVEISEIEGVDVVLGAREKFNLFEVIDSFDKQHACQVLSGKIEEVNEFVGGYSVGDRTRSFLKVQDGCDYKCSFCTIPLARGESRSDSLENVLANARKIGRSGVKEIVLTGVNIGDYGKGLPYKFIDLVKALDEVKEVTRFRISSIEPNLLSDDIIEFVAHSERFMPHFHVPLQSGNNELLSKMRRRYKRELYESRVAKIKSEMPHACIGVDVIVGFPGESESHFTDTYNFLNELPVSYLHVFTYSERNNTLAPTMDDPVDMHERHLRSKMLRGLSEKKKRYFYEQFVGQSGVALLESENKEGFLHGFTDNYLKVQVPFSSKLTHQLMPVQFDRITNNGLMESAVLSSTEVPAI